MRFPSLKRGMLVGSPRATSPGQVGKRRRPWSTFRRAVAGVVVGLLVGTAASFLVPAAPAYAACLIDGKSPVKSWCTMGIWHNDKQRGYSTFIQAHISHDLLPGYLQPSDRDGWYGPQTKSEVETMQTARGIVSDGVVGPQSWGFMHNDMSYRTELLYVDSGTWNRQWRWEFRIVDDSSYYLFEWATSGGSWIYTAIDPDGGSAGPFHRVTQGGI